MSEIVQYLIQVDKLVRAIDGIPYVFKSPVEEWISERNQWIMYAAPECETKSQAISAPLPNIWIGSPSADGSKIYMGLSYQTKPLVETFMQLDSIPNQETHDKFLTIISKVSEDWLFTIQKKTRWDTFASSPEYDTVESIPSSKIDSQKITEILKRLKKIKEESLERNTRVEGRRIDYQGPAFNIMEACVDFPSVEFGVHVREIFDIFQMCLAMKKPATILQELEIMKKDIQFLKVKLQEVEKAIKRDLYGQKSKLRMMELAKSYRLELESYPKSLTESNA